jgi:exopolyphosphatase/guanosine-5'-triphosphate,3'-diphosphate pyrophosphatase
VRSSEGRLTRPARRGRRRRGGRRRRRAGQEAALATDPFDGSSDQPATVLVPAADIVRRPAAPTVERLTQATRYYAALDLGTNNCRLLVAAPRERGFRVVDSFSRIVRLGEGLGQAALLSDAAMDRAIAALEICRGKLERRSVMRSRLIATEACRLAENGEAFLKRVKAETGLELEVVSQETEARLAAAGCASLIDPTASGAILFDIGGGSTELVWIDLAAAASGGRRRISETIRSWQSLPLGVVNLSERHGGGRDVDDTTFEAMVDVAAALLARFPEVESLDRAVAAGGIHMLGTSGTITTLAGVYLGLDRYDRRKVDGLWMSDADVGRMIAELRQTDYDARVANPCIGPDRADLVLAGCAILEAIRRRWPCDRMRVADRGLREGILVELMSADGVWRRRSRRNRRGSWQGAGGRANGKA